jgi:hypothetical protein
LIEESRTNSLTYSEDFGNAAWTKGGSTVSTDTTTAPTGTTVADSLIEDSSTGQHRVFRNATGTTNTNPYTLSVFAKANTRTRIYFGIAEGTTFVRQGNAVFDLSAGTVVSAVSGSGGATGGSATITPVGNGWYRCTYTLTLGGTDTTVFSDLNLVSTGTTITYTGDGTSGLFIWGAQLEAGAFPTSYIPTTTTALTRAADVASVNTLSPWFNATEGTLYAQGILVGGPAAFPYQAALVGSNANTDSIGINWSSPGGQMRFVTRVSSSGQADLNAGSNKTAGSSYKVAGRYAANNFQIAVDGTLGTQDTSGSIPTIAALSLGGGVSFQPGANVWLQRVTYYPRVLPNAQLQALTAP